MERAEANPLRVLDSKRADWQEVLLKLLKELGRLQRQRDPPGHAHQVLRLQPGRRAELSYLEQQRVELWTSGAGRSPAPHLLGSEVIGNASAVDVQLTPSVKVSARVVEGGKERIQIFEGTIMRLKGGGIARSITVRKIASATEEVTPSAGRPKSGPLIGLVGKEGLEAVRQEQKSQPER